jgi:hypothetical protein
MIDTPILGLDFGNVIKGPDGMMTGFMDALRRLKVIFEDKIYIISRVDTLADEYKVSDYLDKHDIYKWINFFNVNFCRRRDEKGPIAENLGISHFVDDRTEVLSYMKSVKHRYALNPTEQQLKDFPPDNVIVERTWPGIVGLIIDSVKKVDNR